MGREALMVAQLLVGLSCSCIEPNPRYCDDSTPCPDPRWPVCDLEGTFPISNYTPNLCVVAAGSTAEPRDSGPDHRPAVVTSDAGPDAETLVHSPKPLGPAHVVVTPQSIDWGMLEVGTPATAETVRLINQGGAATGSIRLDLYGSSDFLLSSTNCDGVLNAHQGCELTVAYAPSAAGPASAIVQLVTHPGGSALLLLGGSGRVCGNDRREGDEVCDRTDLGQHTCLTLGFDGGALGCDSDCELNTSDCTKCGNGIIEGREKCEGSGQSADFGGRSCQSFVHRSSGELFCQHCRIDYSACEQEPY